MTDTDLKRKSELKAVHSKDPIEKLRYKCLSRGAAGIKELARVFRIADVNDDNKLTADELVRICQVYKLDLPTADVQAAFKKVDTDGSGSLSFDEFLLALRVTTSILNIELQAPIMTDTDLKRKSELKAVHSKDPIEKLRYKCLSRGAAGIKELARVFRIADVNDDNKLTADELVRICQVYKLDLPTADVQAAFKKVDSDGSGSLSFDEFLLALRPPMNENRLKLIDMAFKKLDKTGDGVITVADLKNVYNCKKNPKFCSGEKTEEEIFKDFLANFEIGGHVDGKVTKEEFINYYAGVSAAIDTDVYFDLMMRNSWKL
uniref:EF-hand domain-containing protein n=1 Tax=Panagrolaimus sp. JU765 TaxID=591449 RepID=A0AC34Q045_9BILA